MTARVGEAPGGLGGFLPGEGGMEPVTDTKSDSSTARAAQPSRSRIRWVVVGVVAGAQDSPPPHGAGELTQSSGLAGVRAPSS